eukprot:5459125-Alexandrium_andersonii.AAC.1
MDGLPFGDLSAEFPKSLGNWGPAPKQRTYLGTSAPRSPKGRPSMRAGPHARSVVGALRGPKHLDKICRS